MDERQADNLKYIILPCESLEIWIRILMKGILGKNRNQAHEENRVFNLAFLQWTSPRGNILG